MKKYLIPLLFAFAFAFVSCDDDEVLSHTVLSAPGSLTSSVDNGTYSINFTWNAVNGAAYYVMYYNVQGSNSFEKSGNLTDTQFTFYSEDYGTTYEFKVRAENEDAVSDFSEICTVTVPANWEVTVDAPTNVKAEFDEDTGFITVTWDAVSGATSYTVYYGPEGEPAYSSVPLTDTRYTISVDTYGVNYAIYVQASIGSATSPYSDTVLCNVPASAAPTVPTPVISNVREGLGWVNITLTTDVEYDYQLYDGDTLREDWGAEFIKDNGNGTMEYSIYGLELNKSYSDIRLRAVSKDDGSRSNPAVLEDVTMGNIWQKTTNASAAHLFFEWDDVALHVNWTAGPEADVDPLERTFEMQLAKDADFTDIVYDIYSVSYDNTGSYIYMNWVGRNYYGASGSNATMAYGNTTACLGFLEPSTTYYFRVKAIADYDITYNSKTTTLNAKCGTSAWSPAISATTEAKHVAVDGELLWQDFDDHGWFGDFANNCCGLVPLTTDNTIYGPDAWDGGYGLWQANGATTKMYSTIGAHKESTFPGNGETAINGSNGLYAFNGDVYPSMDGWYSSKAVMPAAGAFYMGKSSADVNFISTPAFDDLSEPTAVTISYDASSASAAPTPVELVLNIYRIDTKATETIATDTLDEAYETDPVNGTQVIHLCAKMSHLSHEATINPGDYVMLEVTSVANKSHAAYIDNISIVKK